MLGTLSVKYNSGRSTEGEPVTGKTGTAGSEEGVRKRTATATRLAPILQDAIEPFALPTQISVFSFGLGNRGLNLVWAQRFWVVVLPKTAGSGYLRKFS